MAVIDDKNKPVQQAGDFQNVASRSGEDVMDIDSNTANGDTLIATSPVREEPPTPQEQSTIISDLYQKHATMGADQVWYLISAKWARAYRAFANLSDNWAANEEPSQFTASAPSQIDNESLVTALVTGSNDPFLTRVRKTVTEGMDYEVLPQQVWDKLYAWFGGGPVIARRTYQKGTKHQIAIHPYFVSVGLCGKGAAADMSKNPLTFKEIGVPRTTPMKELKTIIKKLFNLTATPDSDLRLFSAHSGSPYQLYSDEELDRDVEEIIERPQGQQLILEEKNATAPYWRIKAADDSESEPIKSKTTGATVYSFADKKSYTDKYSSTYTNSNNGDNVTSEPGVCGLQNLGNTCFMNSALQCLTKTPVIRDYFVNGTYQDEINRDNPLGMGGKIAEAFGNLMKDGFSGRHSYISPREFKHVIGKFAPQFSGYQQQDSQELIAYLLDGLHEDLNRIKKKPVTESVESNGRPDDVVADEAWKTHRLRNDSVIVDKFQGQLKSELVCPDCENVSITFDPFMYLSLPLPVERHRSIDVTVFFYGNRRAPLKIQVQVQKGGDIVELRKAIADMVGIAKPQNLAVVEVFSNKVYRYFSDSTDIKAILDSDIIMAYEMKEDIEFPEDIHTKYTNYDLKALPFASVRMATTVKEEYRSAYSNSVTVTHRTSYISHPFVVPFDQKQTTNKALYDHCLDYLKPYLKPEEVERLGLNLNDPASLLYKGPTEKQKLRMEAEKERQRKIREKEEKQRRAYMNRYSHDSSDSDTMADEDKEEELQIPADDEEEDEQLLLFTLQFEDSSSYGPAKLDALDNVLPYNDNIVEIPREKYSYSTSDKKTIVMYINPVCIEGLIDQQALKQVDLHDSIKPVKTGGEKGAVSLDACLELFTTREKLSSNDTWYCPKCKKHVEAYKKFDLWRLPEVLVVHLKRFQYNRYTRDKLETFIDYPIEGLDLSKHVEHNLAGNPNRRYDLFAVSNHYGGLGGGHYTAYAKIQRKNQWYKFDDSYTSPVSADSVKTSSGYVLFYKLANNQTTNNMEE